MAITSPFWTGGADQVGIYCQDEWSAKNTPLHPIPPTNQPGTLCAVKQEIARELREAGVPNDLVPDLVELARDIEEVPEPEPDQAWQSEARARLLKRFDQQRDTDTGDDELA